MTTKTPVTAMTDADLRPRVAAALRDVTSQWRVTPAKLDVAADVVLAALADAGLVVVPAAETREEWALETDRPGDRVWRDVYGDRGQAQEWQALSPAARLVRRVTHTGPWEPAPDA
jgi:hypothetical protein